MNVLNILLFFSLREAIMFFLPFVSFAAVFFMLKYFIAVFTKKKFIQYCIASLATCLLIYSMFNKNDAVRMKEDTLYILPKSEMNDSIYDGSKNDPNLK